MEVIMKNVGHNYPIWDISHADIIRVYTKLGSYVPHIPDSCHIWYRLMRKGRLHLLTNFDESEIG